MNKQNLFKLQKRAKGSTILYIEKNKQLQDKIGKFLSLTFDKCYQSFTSEDGMAKLKKYNPDVILTDLMFDELYGVDLIMQIQDIQDNSSIIILSKENEELELLEDFDMGLVDILLKPVNTGKLILSLIKALKINYESKVDDIFIQEITSLKDKQTKIEFINSYNGIPIINSGLIIALNDDEFKIKVPKIQLYSIKSEQHTVFKIENIDKYVEAFVLSINTKNDIITLYKPRYIHFQQRDSKNKRIKTDKSFQVGLHFKSENIEVTPIDISHTCMALYYENPTLQFKQNDEVEITIGFDIKSANKMITDKRFTKVFASGKIRRVEPQRNRQKITVTMNINQAGKRVFNEYLQGREIDIIHSLKNLINK